jgi:hypothetical protein
MQDSEEYAGWLESRRLIISRLTAMDLAIHELGVRIDGYNEVSREKTLQIANQAETAFADLKKRVAARDLLAILWSGAIGLLTGGLAAVVVELFRH